MSADTCVVYFGLRYEVDAGEVEALEERSDWRVSVARKAGLKYYWGDFGEAAPKHLLFVGAEVALVGPENSTLHAYSRSELAELFDTTIAKLRDAGLQGVPMLHVQWQPDR